MDIEHFFESIQTSHIEDVLNKNSKLISEKVMSLTAEDIDFISKICTYNGHLTIGSVCSPSIANAVMTDFDNKVLSLLPEKVIYTRYADDLVFSSIEWLPEGLIGIVKDAVQGFRLKVNEQKTCFMKSPRRKMVTGLVIDRGKVSIGLNKRKKIKKLLYNKLKYNKGSGEQILGYLAFLKDIEPEYYNMLIIKYSSFGNVLDLLKNSNLVPRQAIATEP